MLSLQSWLQKVVLASVAALLLTSCSGQQIDAEEAIIVADKFYAELKSGDVRASLSYFAPEFKQEVENWPSLLDGLQKKYGPITSFELQKTSFVGMKGEPCHFLTHEVKRGELVSTESLLLCSKEGSSPWLIRGAKITRLDSQQSISAGTVLEEMKIIDVQIP